MKPDTQEEFPSIFSDYPLIHPDREYADYADSYLDLMGFTSSRRKASRPPVERLAFGNQSLISYPADAPRTFKLQQGISVNKHQKCLIDNLWMSGHKEDKAYLIACLNALAAFFQTEDKTFKYYAVWAGKVQGLFHTWAEASKSTTGFKNPQYKGFHHLDEAHAVCRSNIGVNYYVSPTIPMSDPRQPTSADIQYTVACDTDKIIFCDYCQVMEKTVKYLEEQIRRKDYENTSLKEENERLRQELERFKIFPPLTKGKNTQLPVGGKTKTFPVSGIIHIRNNT